MKLTFAELLINYLDNCINLKQLLTRDNITEADRKYLEGRRKQNFFDFQTNKQYVKNKEMFKHRKPTKHEIKKYKIDGDFPIVRILEYRGEIIPIYLDDYGQQEFCIYKNKEISGGSYNCFSEYEFMYEIDKCSEKKFFESDLDEPVEWKKLKRLWKKELLEDIK